MTLFTCVLRAAIVLLVGSAWSLGMHSVAAAEPGKVPGYMGQAVLTGWGCPQQGYAVEPGGATANGTVALWFSPQDWDNQLRYVQNLPTETVPLLRGLYRDPESDELRDLFQLGVYRMSETKGGRLWVRHAVQPGQWYHMSMTWADGQAQVQVNGKPADDWVFRSWVARDVPAGAKLERLELGHAIWRRGAARKLIGLFTTGTTAIDELRYYDRVLTPTELANVYQSYFPDGAMRELTPTFSRFSLNQATKEMESHIEFLTEDRDRVASARLVLTDASGAVRLDHRLEQVQDGRIADKTTVAGDLYGDFTVALSWFDADGAKLGDERIALPHPAPPWYSNTLGLHPGEVLPGWEPIRREANTLHLLDKDVEVDARGWPSGLTAAGRVLQSEPVRLLLESGDGVAIDLAPRADGPEIVSEASDRVAVRGIAASGPWQLTTTTETEFDGFTKMTLHLEGPTDATVRRLRVELPLQLEGEAMVGFWAGDKWFRGSCDYRALPEGEGVVFSSHDTGRLQPESWKERVSFLPFIAVSDGNRGLFWMAENDRNWSQSAKLPAQEIVRADGRLWLRLNLVHEEQPLATDEAREFTFYLQATPVRPAAMIDRKLTSSFDFAMVDGFNGNLIPKAMGSHLDFQLDPDDGDWETAAERAERSRNKTSARKGLLYLDHTWQRAPQDALEYQRDWRGWGGASAYTPAVRDCLAWYQNEYLRRDMVDGFYIDDCWVKPTKSHAPSYQRDGKTEWGFDFIGFRESLKRMRWLFHDNGKKPYIVVHVTQTLYYPLFVFTDVLVDGEDRFPPWGYKRTFIERWGLPRLRFSAATASGLPTAWMNAIGNKAPKPGPMDGWVFREARSFIGLCAVSDVWPSDSSTAAYARSLQAVGIDHNAATFTGYWDAQNPVKPTDPAVLASVYRLPDHVVVVLLNTGAKEAFPDIAMDEAVISKWLDAKLLDVKDADPFDPPTEKDLMDYREDAKAAATAETSAEISADDDNGAVALLEELGTDIEEEATQAEDPHPELGPHDVVREGAAFRLRIRPRDYRLLIIRKGEEQ